MGLKIIRAAPPLIPTNSSEAQKVQRIIRGVKRGLGNIHVCLDDTLFASQSAEHRLDHLRAFSDRHGKHGVTTSTSKYERGVPSVTIIRQSFLFPGAAPLPGKLIDVHDHQWTRTYRQLVQLLGMVVFRLRFIPNLAEAISPLRAKSQGTNRKFAFPVAAKQVSTFAA